MNEIYHEKQSKELCALHALNNIFQIKDAFSQVNMTVENSNDKLFNLMPKLDIGFHPHGISTYEDTDGKIYLAVVNHHSSGLFSALGGHSVEIFTYNFWIQFDSSGHSVHSTRLLRQKTSRGESSTGREKAIFAKAIVRSFEPDRAHYVPE